jgi:hypothetical protein
MRAFMTVLSLAAVALAAPALATGDDASPALTTATCPHTDVVFYTTDTTRLATELGKAPAACTDYYLSITPTAGAPRGGLPITTIRSLGPQFHAMAEIRLNAWTAYAGANGWYAAGVEVRREMRNVGYDAGLGDTWAVNEVGAPSGTPMGVDVFKNNGTARHDLLDFIRGLYTGDDGVADPGLVFAADPLQVTTDLSQYEQDLENWYADDGFWTGVADYVRFWAQETYADARAWGVADAPLVQRSAYLNDYFLHGIRLAQRQNGSTAAARAFFAKAYTPVGNASYRYGAPNTTTGIGFGYTDIALTGMQNFVSTQTYALRSTTGARFGFAVVPSTSGNVTATQTVAVEDRIAAAIHDSATQSAGVCGASGEWCDTTVADAQFNEAWKTFANTLEGSPVGVQVAPGVSVTYPTVTARGSTWAETSPPSAAAPPRFQLRPGQLAYDLETTADYTAPVTTCVAYQPDLYDGYSPHLFLLASDGWADITTSTDAAQVCGSTDALGTFAVFAADPTPPVIVPHVNGPLGSNGWYTGDVTVTWSVTDPQSRIVTSRCDTTAITTDTTGTTLTCTATSDGGTASAHVTVKRDATPPIVTCIPTPSTLWPPNGKLVPVTVEVAVSDATAAPDGFVLAETATTLGDPARDIVEFDLGVPDTTGLLRARRPGTADERVYSLVYVGRDVAGNTGQCVSTIAVPRDLRAGSSAGP